MIGTRLGNFRITDKLGEGGMGEVYRATDAKLGREVAIKVLPEAVAADPERLARFEREARMLASLNHPNIAAIYSLESAGMADAVAGHDQATNGGQPHPPLAERGDRPEHPVHFLVMELVEGETLQERIQKGALSVDESLTLGLQIAEAFEAAHRQGIMHRDLKPANVKVTPDGQVKVLDFGLAKALETDPSAAASGASLTQSPTLTAQMTGAGVLLGTAGYMSPEQARGEVADTRADIWAYGVVLMEMLTGRTVYSGRTISDTLANVLKDEPKWEELPTRTPVTIRNLLERCLEKEANDRLQSIGEARIAIRQYLDDPEAATAVAVGKEPERSRPRLLWIVAALAMGVLLGALTKGLQPEPPAAVPVRKFEVTQAGLSGYWATYPKISPDGRALLLTTTDGIWIRELDELEARLVAGTEKSMGPFWSPDSRFIGFAADRKLWKVAIDGGNPVLICELPGRGRLTAGAWAPDDRILIATWRGDLYTVSSQGGDPKLMLDLDLDQDIDIHHLSLLPDGETVLFTPHSTSGTFPIEALRQGERQVVMEIEGQQLNNPVFSRSGHLLYQRSGTNEGVWAVPFSASEVATTGEPFLVAPDFGLPSVGSDGTLTYSTLASAQSQLRWIDRQGLAGEALGEPRSGLRFPALSPDGSRVLVILEDSGSEELWVFDLERETWTRLTFEESNVDAPGWTPEGDRVVYESALGGTGKVAIVSADGTDQPEILVEGGVNPTLSPDGTTLFYEMDNEGRRELWSQPLDGSSQASRLFDSRFDLRRALLDPSGRLLAYISDESGANQVYLTQYPSLQGKWQVTRDGGYGLTWSRDGKRFYFETFEGLWEVDVEVEPALRLGTPRQVFAEAKVGVNLGLGLDISPEGDRFLVVQSAEFQDGSSGVVVVQNWLGEFQD